MATVYSLPGYPTMWLTNDGEQVTIRPMVTADEHALLEFFRRVPAEDRLYLKEDVTSPAVIRRWAQQLDYNWVLPLLALKDSRIVGDGTLHHSRRGVRKHIGEVRIVVDPEFRNRGVGRGLLHKLIDIARERGLEKLILEIVLDAEEAARRTAQILGFVPVAILPGHIRDSDGTYHDLMIMELRLHGETPAMPEIYYKEAVW